MNEKRIIELIQETFAKLSCPAQGHGMYAEIEKAVKEAFNLGKSHQTLEMPLRGERVSFIPNRA